MDPHVKPDPDNLDDLPPPPSIPLNVTPIKFSDDVLKATKPKRTPMSRPGFGKKGNVVPLLTNHFKVSVRNMDDCFYHYSVGYHYSLFTFSL